MAIHLHLKSNLHYKTIKSKVVNKTALHAINFTREGIQTLFLQSHSKPLRLFILSSRFFFLFLQLVFFFNINFFTNFYNINCYLICKINYQKCVNRQCHERLTPTQKKIHRWQPQLLFFIFFEIHHCH
jgi:hypothetical protein